MAKRKVEDDVLARGAAEREIGEALIAEGIASETDVPAELGRRVLGRTAQAVQFEIGESTDPDRRKVAMRRLVITGPWMVDPTAAALLQVTPKQ